MKIRGLNDKGYSDSSRFSTLLKVRSLIANKIIAHDVITALSSILLLGFGVAGIVLIVIGELLGYGLLINWGWGIFKVFILSFIINSVASYVVGGLSTSYIDNRIDSLVRDLEENIRSIGGDLEKSIRDVGEYIIKLYEEEIYEGRQYSVDEVIIDFIIKPTNPENLKEPWNVLMIEKRRGINFNKQVRQYQVDAFILDILQGDISECKVKWGKIVECLPDGSIKESGEVHITNDEPNGQFNRSASFEIRPGIDVEKHKVKEIVIGRWFPSTSNAWPIKYEYTDKNGKKLIEYKGHFGYTVMIPIRNRIVINILIDNSSLEAFKQNVKMINLDITTFEGIRCAGYIVSPRKVYITKQKLWETKEREETIAELNEYRDHLKELGYDIIVPLARFEIKPEKFDRFYIGHKISIDFKLELKD